MKISEQWLREWVAVRLDAKALAERLTLAGLEVGSVAPVAGDLSHVVVGEILAVAPHPQADRLRVCQVNVGRKKPLTIVCGAANAAAGLKVPAALEGAVLPNGTRIAATQIRGVDSAGMLCSAAELGLEEQSSGLLVLDRASKPGTPVVEVLGLDDRIIEIDLTPNRGDCLSILGLAREVAALTGARFTPQKPRPPATRSRRRLKVTLKVTLKAPAACARYAGRAIEDINPQAETPLWLRERLRRGGVRSIHPVVDITNLVMLELGQPMHAFDLDRLAGGIQVRFARARETLELLDGTSPTLESSDLVIADDRRPVALAGIMGGQQTAVTSGTRHIFLESAWFRPEVIGLRARHHGLHSESSHRFERGVDPQLQRRALDRATQLILEICGGRAGPATEAVESRQLPRAVPILLRAARIERVLGMTLPAAQVESILKRLDMRVARARDKSGRAWKVTAPSWRFDLVREVDLIEELARVHGYQRVPVQAPPATLHVSPLSETRVAESRLRSVLIDRDYQEVITYSFVDPALQALIMPDQPALALANPIASDLAQMRTSLWPGLIQTVRHNLNRQQTRVRVFELGRRFRLGANGATDEQQVLSGVACGDAHPEQWGSATRPVDFFDVKADVEALLASSGQAFLFRPARHAALHPGQAAEIVQAHTGVVVGILGTLHPGLEASTGLDKSAILFEVTAEALQTGVLPQFQEFSRFPSVRRDIAVIVDQAVSAQVVLEICRESAGNLLVNLQLFDEYRGEGIDSGRKSLALGLTFQDTSRTLSDKDVDAVVGRVVADLQARFNAQLRQ